MLGCTIPASLVRPAREKWVAGAEGRLKVREINFGYVSAVLRATAVSSQ